jgi:hypothetical protein
MILSGWHLFQESSCMLTHPDACTMTPPSDDLFPDNAGGKKCGRPSSESPAKPHAPQRPGLRRVLR